MAALDDDLTDFDDDRLDSWKEIAVFFDRGVTTVQRWEVNESLPVHRHEHAKRGTVYAFKSELKRWHAARESNRAGNETEIETEADGEPSAGLRLGELPHDVPAPPVVSSRPAPARLRFLRLLVVLPILAVAALAMRTVIRPRADSAPSVTLSRPLANDASYEAYPTLSPDGSMVAYRWSDPRSPGVYLKRTTGGEPWPLLVDGPPSVAGRSSFPKWSPDGRSMAFLREVGSSVWDVRVVSIDGGESRHVTQITSGSVSWLPDSRTLAVADRPASGEPYSVFLVSTDDGHRIRRVTSPPLGTFGDWHCSISPDGTRLAVARFRSGDEADVFVTGIEQGEAGMVQLTHDSVGLGHLEWTPDGRVLVFASQRANRAALWEISAEPGKGHEPVLVAGADGGAHHPTLARAYNDGTLKLAYQFESSAVTIWRRGRENGSIASHIVTPTHTASDRHPSWSPDGSHIVFASDRSGDLELWIADTEGGPARQLTLQSGLGIRQPRWSPTGDWILFTAARGGQQDIYKVRVDGTNVMRVTYDPSDERNGSWSRDGRRIYFRSNRGGSVRVWKTEADHRVEPVPATAAESSEAIESLDGKTLYFTKHDDAGLWQKPLPDGPEILIVPDWHAREGFWDVIQEGILMIDKQVVGSKIDQPLTLYSFTSRTLIPYGTLPGLVSRIQDGMSARPDGSLLWAQIEPNFSDVMLFEHWQPRSTP